MRWVQFRYPGIRIDLARMIRDNLYARMLQTRYVFRDFLIRKPYKIISYRGEFQQELLFVLPFAYWHHLNGTLQQTVSSIGTKDLYFFSPKHEERFRIRSFNATRKAYRFPNLSHSNHYSYLKWCPVPFKEHFANTTFVYDKPSLIIANKYNQEWDLPPINYLDKKVLEEIITLCRDKFQIIYNRPQPVNIVEDNSKIYDLGEHEWLRHKFPEVLLMDDLYKQFENDVNSFNHLQLMVYANCSHFISVHGGTGAFASYFGGKNILLSNPKHGREYLLGEYQTIFPKLSGALILHAHYREDIIPFVQQYFMQKPQSPHNTHSILKRSKLER